jgi:toxin ParE1/3/4
MARVVRSPLARADIVDVLKYTRDRYGKEQAREYRNLIREALNAIAAEPQLGRVRGTRPGILSYHIKQPGRNARHIVFYRVSSAGALEIVRFLHDSMDFDQHLQDPP